MSAQIQPSIATRLVVAKTLGTLFGLMTLVGLSIMLPESSWLMRFGILAWYITLGGIVGLIGVLDSHPVLSIPLPWWVRGPCVGAWMNFVLVLCAYDLLSELILRVSGHMVSPFWFVAEGAFIGAIIGWASTYFGGEGPATLEN